MNSRQELLDRLHRIGKELTEKAAKELLEQFEGLGMTMNQAYAEIIYHASQGRDHKETESKPGFS